MGKVTSGVFLCKCFSVIFFEEVTFYMLTCCFIVQQWFVECV